MVPSGSRGGWWHTPHTWPETLLHRIQSARPVRSVCRQYRLWSLNYTGGVALNQDPMLPSTSSVRTVINVVIIFNCCPHGDAMRFACLIDDRCDLLHRLHGAEQCAWGRMVRMGCIVELYKRLWVQFCAAYEAFASCPQHIHLPHS